MTIETTTRAVRYSDPVQVLAGMQEACGHDNAFLLESLSGPDSDLRASVVGALGLLELRVVDRRVSMSGQPRVVEAATTALLRAGAITDSDGRLELASDAALWTVPEVLNATFTPDGVPAANIGVLAYYGYEAVRYVEHLPRPEHLGDPSEPDAVFSLVHASVTMPYGSSIGYAAAVATELWDAIDLDALCVSEQRAEQENESVPVPVPVPVPSSVHDDCTFAEYEERTRRALEHIRAGDIYQIQIGHEITVTTSAPPMTVYRRMRHHNASPYMCYLPIAGAVITGASPELFVRVDRDSVMMRPIAGTARRTNDGATDTAAVDALLASEKERAEHIMLVDLCRNDLGRVALTDSTATRNVMAVEEYSHVFHLVTTVAARFSSDESVSSVIRSTFPAGTMTGAPKVRAMQIIDQLETSPRGFYAGAFGIIGPDGDAVLGLGIRMAVHRDGRYRIRASAGIVADSTAEGEWNETLAKLGAAFFAVTGEELR